MMSDIGIVALSAAVAALVSSVMHIIMAEVRLAVIGTKHSFRCQDCLKITRVRDRAFSEGTWCCKHCKKVRKLFVHDIVCGLR